MDQGANEFYLTASGPNIDKCRELRRRLSETLRPYFKSEAPRLVPSYCLWREEPDAPLWRLTRSSIELLKPLGLERLFAPGSGTGFMTAQELEEWMKGYRQYATYNHLCLFRDTKPMFAIFEEDSIDVLVVLRPDERAAFDSADFGIRYTIIHPYEFGHYGMDAPSVEPGGPDDHS